jgi:hypothetical protein
MNTGEKIASAGFPNPIVENLERRFAALEKSCDSYNLFLAERSYIDYLERERSLHPIIKAIFAEREYDDVGLRIICVFSMTTRGHAGVPKVPGFLEGLYPQDVTWKSVATSENNRQEIAYYAAIGETVGASRERAREITSGVIFRNDLSLMRKLHNDLLERLLEPIPLIAKLKSIHLIGDLIDPYKFISLVLDERYEHPIRFDVKNRKGEETAVKKLYNIADPTDAPGKRVRYDERDADNINSGPFKNKQVKDYMKSKNILKKPQLVAKSHGVLVLKNIIIVKTMLPTDPLLADYRSLYVDKER